MEIVKNSIKLHKLKVCIEMVSASLPPEDAEDYALVQRKARGYYLDLSNKEIGNQYCKMFNYKDFTTEPIKDDPMACTFIFYKL